MLVRRVVEATGQLLAEQPFNLHGIDTPAASGQAK